MRHVATERTRELDLVVGVDSGVVLPPRHGDVRQPLVDQLLARTLRLDMYQDSTGGLPLATVTCHGVPVIQMASFMRFE